MREDIGRVKIMDLPWGDERTKKFITNVGLITSNGPNGQDIMAAEWTHHVSYSPGLIMINIHTNDATYENIKKTKEFGVNLCAVGQNVASSIAGGSHGQDVDKVAVLKELGYEFYAGKKIKVLMLKGASLNIECNAVKKMQLGDHAAVVGEVLDATSNDKQPLAYHDGKYWKLGEQIAKPQQEVLDKIKQLVESHKKK